MKSAKVCRSMTTRSSLSTISPRIAPVPIIRQICAEDKHVRAIFNTKNFGQFNSPYYGMIHTSGDCTITICADFQDPVEMIPKFVAEWEKGYKIVIGRKTKSEENPLVYFLRGCYYKTIPAR